jgi:esterase/lipase superfamily enzyme
MNKVVQRWYSERVELETTMVRWGHWGRPVLLLPTAGGDAEEVERNGLVEACEQLLADGRIKLYSVDSVAGSVMVRKTGSPEYRLWLLNQFHQYVRFEVVPAIHSDTGGDSGGIIAAGASIGAFNAVALVCRYPEIFSAAIGMSGTYAVEQFYDPPFTEDFYCSAPLRFLPGLDGAQLERLRRGHFVVLATGSGRWETVGESWQMAEALGDKGIPNRVDDWGSDWDHDWPTWRCMLPQYLDELTR